MQNTHSTNMHGFIEGDTVVKRNSKLKNKYTVLATSGYYNDDCILIQADHVNPGWEFARDYKAT